MISCIRERERFLSIDITFPCPLARTLDFKRAFLCIIKEEKFIRS